MEPEINSPPWGWRALATPPSATTSALGPVHGGPNAGSAIDDSSIGFSCLPAHDRTTLSPAARYDIFSGTSDTLLIIDADQVHPRLQQKAMLEIEAKAKGPRPKA